MSYIEELALKANNSSFLIANASTIQKDNALRAISQALKNNIQDIIAQNQIDIDNAIKNDMSISMQDRLMLDEKRINKIADSVIDITKLNDPVGSVLGGGVRPNGLKIIKTRVPLGVIAIIYESRPNVTVDAAVLCLKSGNAVILRGGKEAYNSNKCLADIMRKAVASAGLPEDIICFIEDTSREASHELMKCSKYIDVLIPRGGAGLISACKETATIPVIETGTGNCHAFVDESADLDMAVDIVDNSKTSRPSVCNALESLLVHRNVAEKFLPMMQERFLKHKVEIRGCNETLKILNGTGNNLYPASDDDYYTEFLDYIISVKIVDSLDEAITHINKYSTKHSETIITNNLINAEKFQRQVDSAAVYVNASTRFTDGGEFGLGAEIGIATQKLHSRGPMGLNELTTVKYLINGNGQIR